MILFSRTLLNIMLHESSIARSTFSNGVRVVATITSQKVTDRLISQWRPIPTGTALAFPRHQRRRRRRHPTSVGASMSAMALCGRRWRRICEVTYRPHREWLQLRALIGGLRAATASRRSRAVGPGRRIPSTSSRCRMNGGRLCKGVTATGGYGIAVFR